MEQNNKEYGIIIIKPDGIKCKIIEELQISISNHHLEIVKIKEACLNKEQVYEFFVTPFDKLKYAEYISSNKCIIILVYGYMTGYKLFHIKYNLRRKHGFSNKDMENLIHASDPGNEYFMQFKLFFQN